MNDRPAHEIAVHVPRMYRVALRVVAEADTAHDVVQEACVRALQKLDSFQGRSSLATWLHRITVNCANDALRSDARRRQGHGQLQAWPVSAVAENGPADAAEQRELFGLAWRALDGLPPECRLAFSLTQLDGYSYDEAAEIEGQPRGTIASRVYRAKKLLLEQMGPHMHRRAEQ